jgi:palmitoyltransferase
MRANGGRIEGTDQTHGRIKDLDTPKDTEAGVLDAIPLSARSKEGEHKSKAASSEQRQKKKRNSLKRSRPSEKEKPRIHVDRRPSTVPVLLPEHRYCGLDEIVKPYRTHHCRTCGTVRFWVVF